MKDFAAADWERMAQPNGLGTFEAIWALDIGWFEAPNERRGGWGGVSRHEVALPDGRREGVFIKRQLNHTTRTWSHPFRGIATFRREFRNLMRLRSCGVPVLDALYYAERAAGGDRRAILVTRELAGYASLEDRLGYWRENGFPDRAPWHKLMHGLAETARRMHRHRVQQNCLYPKHVFLGEVDGGMDIRLLDFEKARRTLRAGSAMLRDLDTLNRRSPGLRTTDRLRFLLAYLGRERVDRRVRRAWHKLVKLACRKAT